MKNHGRTPFGADGVARAKESERTDPHAEYPSPVDWLSTRRFRPCPLAACRRPNQEKSSNRETVVHRSKSLLITTPKERCSASSIAGTTGDPVYASIALEARMRPLNG